MISRKRIVSSYLYLPTRNTHLCRFVHKQKSIISRQYLPNMHRTDRRSSRSLAPTNGERRKYEPDVGHRRADAPNTYDEYHPDWKNMRSSNTAPKPSRETYEAATPQAQSHRHVGRNYSHASVSPPSAAATARQNTYVQRPKMQSTYKAESLAVRDHDAAPFAGQKSKCIKLPKQAYQPGMLIRAVIHEPNLDRASGSSSITVTDLAVTETRYGLVTSKWRKLIVIGTYQDHYMAVPLYTHNGRGLSRKSKPEEFVSIQDHRQVEPFTALSEHDPLVTEYLYPDVYPLDPISTAHIPYTISRGYVLPVVHEGFLDYESTARLLRLVGTFEFPAPDPLPLRTWQARFIC